MKPTPARFHEGLLSPGVPWNLANRFLVTLLNSVRALPGRLCSLLGRIWDLREGRRIQHFSRLKCNQPRVPGRPFFAPGNENSNWEVETTVRAAIRSLLRVTCSFPPLPFPVTLCSSHSNVAVPRFVSSEFVSSNSRSDLCDALARVPPLSRRTGEHTRIWYPRRDPGGARSLACLRAGTVPYTRVESNIQKKNVWC